MSDYCLYPNQCGVGMDCSPCYQRRIADLEAKLAAAEADAGRYKELRDRLRIRNKTSLAGGEPRPALEVIIGCAFIDQAPQSPGRGDELDAAIDTARGVE